MIAYDSEEECWERGPDLARLYLLLWGGDNVLVCTWPWEIYYSCDNRTDPDIMLERC
jgi:hypothetical protein